MAACYNYRGDFVLVYRVITAIIGIPLVLWLIWQGGSWLGGGILILALLGQWELKNILQHLGIKVSWLLAGPGVILVFFSMINHRLDYGITFLLLWTLLIAVISFPRIRWSDLGAGFFGIVYVTVSLTYILLLREKDQGLWLTALFFIANWLADSGAYFTGRALGKHPLAPVISPKKSIEGVFGGTVTAALVLAMLGPKLTGFSYLFWAGFGIVISLGGQLGDLAESTLKRAAGVKDSSNIFPGHGGVLDRFDSIMFTAPLAYVLLDWFVRGGNG